LKNGRRSIFGLSLLTFFACQPIPVPISLPVNIQSLAVLPFDNESNDLNAAEILQKAVYLALKTTSYQVSDMEATNEKLASVGIVDGGQLVIIDPVKLGKDLGVQALLFGYVENFNYTNVGFFLQKKVDLQLKLVEVATGQTLWENNGTGSTMEFYGDKDKAKAALAKGLAEQWVEKLLKTPLEAEVNSAVVQALRTLPGFNPRNFVINNSLTRPEKGKFQDTFKEIIKKK
jgi:hypothetical protein